MMIATSSVTKITKFSPIVSYIIYYKLIVFCGPCFHCGVYCVAGLALIIQTLMKVPMNSLILIYVDTRLKVIYIIIELYIYFCII